TSVSRKYFVPARRNVRGWQRLFRLPFIFSPWASPAHEATRPSFRSRAWLSGAEDARTPDASRPRSEPREASGVRPIDRRVWAGPDVHRFMLLMPAQKTKGGSHE